MRRSTAAASQSRTVPTMVTHTAPTIRNKYDFDTAMNAPTKSAELLRELTTYAIESAHYHYTPGGSLIADQILALLAEPELRPADLRDIGKTTTWGNDLVTHVLTAICVHPCADNYTLICVLRAASADQAQKVAAAAGTLLPVVVAWMRLRANHKNHAATNDLSELNATHRRWAAWAAGDPARMSAMITGAFTFAREQDLFAALSHQLQNGQPAEPSTPDGRNPTATAAGDDTSNDTTTANQTRRNPQ